MLLVLALTVYHKLTIVLHAIFRCTALYLGNKIYQNGGVLQNICVAFCTINNFCYGMVNIKSDPVFFYYLIIDFTD